MLQTREQSCLRNKGCKTATSVYNINQQYEYYLDKRIFYSPLLMPWNIPRNRSIDDVMRVVVTSVRDVFRIPEVYD